ncbi:MULTISPECIES: phage major capsid protein [Hydrocarboniphaga]|uniref:Peptidase U35, phage prohead HK97 n=1 Tax=Hydrocarboniphaga effusa AP103 TaxID=1172194 RepID=I8T8F2_9GAMM|nr:MULTISPECIES: phage major capsid protein [Hydrocarboniphaga]EIT69998.1 peptidase U35, phage prohead HK97 [Hydrocarboniphaga effusa AP103]EIT70185.1 peptidase U35, phage prohead HK97 [Hydrocarboniphaga effusa AP103]MDZ4077185.1 phage major capsid protein [Hydrocarboniphaga sp.]
MQRAYSLLTIKSVDEESREITGIASTPTPDRSGDVVEPKGAEFKLPIALFWEHKFPVGQVFAAKVTAAGIEVKARIAKVDEAGTLKDRLDEAWQSIKAGLVRGFSVGFKPKEAARIEGTFGTRYLKWLWLELSCVAIPDNAEASIQTIKSIATQQRAPPATVVVRLTAASPAPVVTIKTPQEGNVNIQQKIQQFEDERVTKGVRMTAIMEAAGDKSLDAEQTKEYDALTGEVKAIDDHLERLRELEKINISKAVPITGIKGPNTTQVKPVIEKGIEFARYVMCLASAKGNLMQAHEIAKSRFADSPQLHTVLKAAVAAGTTTDATWAKPLVEYNDFAGDFVEFLRPQTIIGRFGQGGIPALRLVPFNIHIRGQTSGGAGYWVGEGKPKPLTKFDFNDTYLGWAKVANICVLTEDLVRFSNPNAEQLVRSALAEALISRIDTDFIDPAKAAAANVSPASITYGVAPIESSGNDADAVRADIRAAFAAFIAAKITPTAGVWIMSPTRALALSMMHNALGQPEFASVTMTGGTLQGLPIITSEYVPDDMVILANASDIWLADDGQVVIDASREASLQMDSSPVAGAAELVSMFQTNQVAIRAERWINWSKRRAAAVVVLDNVAWGEPAEPETP